MKHKEYIKLNKLSLSLDEMNNEFLQSIYDIGGCGHDIIIKAENKEKFLDDYAQKYRDKAESLLEKVVHEDEDE